MSDRDERDKPRNPPASGRAERLAAELKANVKKRKEQARARAEKRRPAAPGNGDSGA